MNFYINNCSIRLSDNSNTDLFSVDGVTVKEILSDMGLFCFNPSVIIADPFLFVYNNELYLFYEKQKKWYGKGCICMQHTRDLKYWSNEITVLSEPFHLSFPFVFEYEGQCFMIPETGHDGSICLYCSKDNNLEQWELIAKIIDDGCDWVDSSIIWEKNVFYLFSTKIGPNNQYEQHLFVSDTLTGPFKEHPKSPVYIGNDFGRNAGSVFKYEGSWLRPTQDCVKSYGDNVSLFKIEKLNKTDYSEVIYKHNIIERTGKYKEGGHQFNYVVFNNRTIVATDFKLKNYNLIELMRRIINSIKNDKK